ncbi:hypothetical protein [Mucilaginibacter dorajii]|uniref:Uncharacterized protein n=1 Tax=Mucilaginibacter dorajii TaxID=692994 RepID=A0ABP7PVL6_9SPHI|nr:hypothetical protein [Mucilaginibacter dorajii]MCS3734992.1 hypothetical protein [Mucilaginibacter dorajii]
MEIIDLAIAKQMTARYASTRKSLIDSTYTINDTLSSWIPIDDLKDYVNNLPETATGVRVYLAAYDETETTYPSQTTIILAGTVSDDGCDNDVINGYEPLENEVGLGPVNRATNCPPDCPTCPPCE